MDDNTLRVEILTSLPAKGQIEELVRLTQPWRDRLKAGVDESTWLKSRFELAESWLQGGKRVCVYRWLPQDGGPVEAER